MGCFLTITRHDLAQLNATMKASVSIVGSSGSNEVKIQIHPTVFRSAREMAEQIRQQAKSARSQTSSSQELSNSVPTKERIQYQVAALHHISPALTDLFFHSVQESYKTEMRRMGKIEAEPIAVEILKQSEYLGGAKEVKVTRSVGVDVSGSSKTGTTVVVEVKFSAQDKDFGRMMNAGAYADDANPGGLRQMSDSWLKQVSPDLDPAKANILGVHINPERETVTIYRRIDPEARNWKPLITKPLSAFNLKSLG